MEELNKKNSFFSNMPGFIAGAFILILLINALALFSILIPSKSKLELDSVSDKTIKSPRTIYLKSQVKTKEAQEKAASKVEKVYRFDPSVSVQQKSKADEAFKGIDKVRGGDATNKEELIANVLSLNFSQDISNYITSLSLEDWQKVKSETSNLLNKLQDNEKIKNDEKISDELIEKYLSDSLSSKDNLAIKELASVLVIPNYIFSKEDTDIKIEQAKAEVEPVSLLITQDEVIVRSGKVIDKLDLEKLEAVGLKKTDFFDLRNIGKIIISTLIALIVIFYFRSYYNIYNRVTVTSLKALSIFITFIFLTGLSFQILTPLKPIMYYIIPVAAPILLISVLISSEVAIFSAIIFSIFLGIISSNSLELLAIYLVTSLVGIYALRYVNKIGDFFRIGIYLAFFHFVVAFAFHLIAGSFSIRTVSVLLGAASIYGLGAIVLIIGTLLFWGNIFKVTTLLELLELENPNQSLLKDLSLRAPGTYHHSILVSNLAERAASDIKANSLLVRVGAIYHDIGKTFNPAYFIENQKRYNLHEKLQDPEKSAEIIKSHVSDGIKLAKQNKLPQEIINFIESHHGNSEVFYFLSQAKEKNIEIDLSKFHYSGPLPGSKETAILMLADAIEAKARSLDDLTYDKIKELVFQVVDSKLKSGQLSLSELSLKEIDIIKNSFINTLRTMHHKRIKYPDEKK
ncbi:hypothetical protein COX95_01165 [bacterium CG_4_10_14_0_2_um_filter_33_32]|nr:MAG: hypothetical protein AUJ93_04025 [bacterium CG2_30_33_46]PIR67576.1 MAG: hypothetical protein COU50_02525 [bacterium CG10_big_fil_rev_8_21_14_0_10_33_18]PIU76450.1 MAG: hypothetical protein COS74_03935 [bacterium CG06_land_8_20_14_3_00_33_50]PIW81154.1 MAG: hypothetical protein COZ97_03325 [bacterium CG_4_8_14_3_um_filter_33_28]PIY84888.1 MAG: hypothetical protein COY76_04775 [bacterium CG_4_10_14_0_8_um_filter_33_57]PIZ86511.1 MAG: hypothetical protein COX95_01165 [bacterium CG_4_10_1